MDQDRASPNLPPVDRTSVRMRLDGLRQKALFRIAAAYAVAAWLVIQVAATVAPAFDLSPWLVRAVILLAVLGFVATVGYFGIVRSADSETANDLQRRNRLANRATFGALLVAALAGAGYVARQTLFADEQVSLAVLPFADLSPGRDKAFLAEGVAEEILSALGKNSNIKVLGRSSAWALRDKAGDPAAIRASLGITHLLEGSVRAAGPELRLSVRLIRTTDGAQEWAEDYRGKGEDVFALQDKIANAVAKRLSIRGRDKATTVQAEITSADAYNIYLAARQIARTRSEPELRRAHGLAQQVVAAKPDFAPGHALLSELTWLLSDDGFSYGTVPSARARPIAVIHARKAIALSPQAADGYGALGLVLRGEGGVEPLRKAIKLDPARAELKIWLGVALNELGRSDEAFEQYRVAVESEPLWPVGLNRLVQTLSSDGQIDQAEQVIARYRRRGGSEPQALRFTGFVARAQGDFSRAIAAERAALSRDPTLPYVAGWLVKQYHLLGLPRQALGVEQARGGGSFRRMWIEGDRAGLVRLARSAPDTVLTAADGDIALFGLGAARDLRTIGGQVGRNSAALAENCASQFVLVPHFIIALRETGQTDKSRRLINCMQERITLAQGMKMRSADDDPGRLEMRKASLLALVGERGAIDWLDKAVKRGWSGQYYSTQLADWPQFDALPAERLADLQRTIDARIARERAETLRDLTKPARQAE